LIFFFCNEEEAKEFVGSGDLAVVREELKKVAKTFMITLGKNGSMVWDGTMFIDIEPHIVDAIDSNGAGDMAAGAYLYGITNGHTPAGAASLASMAASQVVSQYGPRLETEEALKIKKTVFGDK
jgi:sugar/nucleoside kinase (ribokinase family)